MGDNDLGALRRARSFWRTRYGPTYAGLWQMSRVAVRASESSMRLVRTAERKLTGLDLSARQHLVFKEVGFDDRVECRKFTALSPWGALVESCAMAALATARAAAAHPAVYSYQLEQPEGRAPFKYFVRGYEQRVAEITRQVNIAPSGSTVVVLDIRRFYPSVSALATNDAISELGRRAPKFVGDYLDKFRAIVDRGLPIGPAASHVVANQILKRFDQRISEAFPGAYTRYVDDLTLVIASGDVARATQLVRDELDALGLELHPGKSGEFSASQWLAAAPTLSERALWNDSDVSIETLVAMVRAFSLAGGERSHLVSALDANGYSLAELAGEARPSSAAAGVLLSIRSRLPEFLGLLGRPGASAIREILDVAATLKRQFRQRLEALAAHDEEDGAASRWRRQRSLRLASRLCLLVPRAELPQLREFVPDRGQAKPLRAVIEALIERRPGLVLAYPGGPVRQLAFLWRMHGLPMLDATFDIRSDPYLESALELVIRGVITPRTPRVDPSLDGARLAGALLRESSRRTRPDLSLEDELESLFLQTPVHRRFTSEPAEDIEEDDAIS